MIKPMTSEELDIAEMVFKTFRTLAELRGVPVAHYWAGCFAEWMSLGEDLGVSVQHMREAFEDSMKLYTPKTAETSEKEIDISALD